MIEDIEELGFQPHGELFAKRDSFCQIHVGPEELGTTKLVPAGVAKLAVGRTVSAETSACTRIYCRNEGSRVEPLHRPRLGDSRNVAVMTVGIHAWNQTCELRSAALHDAIAVRQIRRAQD